MHLVDLTDIWSINQVIELHLLYTRYTGTTVLQWPFQATSQTVFDAFVQYLTYSACYYMIYSAWFYSPCIWLILPVFHQFNPYMILPTFFCLVKPVLDECNLDSNNTWSLQPLFKFFSSIFMYSIDSICLWFILTVYDIFYLYLVDFPGVWHFQSLFNYLILYFGQLNMCMTKTTCIWSILTVFDLFLYMTNSPGSWLI